MKQAMWWIFIVGGILRFANLGERPLWVDEALFGFWVTEGTTQEYTTVLLTRLIGNYSEFGLRFLSALAGSLTIPAVWYSLKNKDYAVYACLLVAVFPLFIFWSRMARPYAFAGLFVALGWRYWWFYLAAIATTPVSLVGVRLWKQNKIILGLLAGIAVVLFFMREDSGREWTIHNLLSSSRLYYVPCLVFILYFTDYLLPVILQRSGKANKPASVVGKRNRGK